MAATNDYVMPRLDGLPYLDKPIVYFAAEAAAMEVLGPTEPAARLPALPVHAGDGGGAVLVRAAGVGSECGVRRGDRRSCRCRWRSRSRAR